MIKVLIVDDSVLMRAAMRGILESHRDMRVVGEAGDGVEALALARELKPDVITMDFQMPDMDGIEATRRIMEECPTPIVIVSAMLHAEEAAENFLALEAGALTLLAKPRLGGPDQAEVMEEIAATVKMMSRIPVAPRLPRRVSKFTGREGRKPSPCGAGAGAAASPRERNSRGVLDKPQQPAFSGTCPTPAAAGGRIGIGAALFDAVCVGASTGGPQALSTLLAGLPADFPWPILVVQHIAKGFTEGLAQWLDKLTPLRVRLARDGEKPLPGVVYFAPDITQMGINGEGVIRLTDDATPGGMKPSVAWLFRSAAAGLRHRAIGVLLTGMGRDGAEELMRMREQGAMTVAQDKETSIVHGMPGAAIALGAARHVLPIEAMADFLTGLARMTK